MDFVLEECFYIYFIYLFMKRFWAAKKGMGLRKRLLRPVRRGSASEEHYYEGHLCALDRVGCGCMYICV